MLAVPDSSISQIAYQLGYTDLRTSLELSSPGRGCLRGHGGLPIHNYSGASLPPCSYVCKTGETSAERGASSRLASFRALKSEQFVHGSLVARGAGLTPAATVKIQAADCRVRPDAASRTAR